MSSQAAERDQFESRVRAVHDLVTGKLHAVSGQDHALADSDPSSERRAVQARLGKPFRAWWDFNKPWRNK